MINGERNSIGDLSRVYANQLSEGLRLGKYMRFDRPPTPFIFNAAAAIPAFPSAGAAQVDQMLISGGVGNTLLEHYQTTAQTLFPSAHATKGLLIGGDVVDNESVEYVPGGNRANNPMAYIAGTDPGVFIKATFEFADVSGTDQFLVGFRRQAAYAVPVSLLAAGDGTYTDFFGVGFSGAANPNVIKTMSDLNDSGSTTVTSLGMTWADGLVHTLEVRVKGRRAYVFINGVPAGNRIAKDALGNAITSQFIGSAPSFTFDSTDVLIPWIFHRYDATVPGAVYLRTLEVGQLLEIGLQKENR